MQVLEALGDVTRQPNTCRPRHVTRLVRQQLLQSAPVRVLHTHASTAHATIEVENVFFTFKKIVTFFTFLTFFYFPKQRFFI